VRIILSDIIQILGGAPNQRLSWLGKFKDCATKEGSKRTSQEDTRQ